MLFSTTDVTMKKTLHINPNINKKKSKERVFVGAEKQTRFPFNYRFKAYI